MRIRPEHAESSHLLDQEGFITQLCQDVAHEESWVKRAWPPAFIREWVRYAYDRATIANGFARDALDMLAFSKRMIDDVHWAWLYDYPVSLFIRPWLDIRVGVQHEQ